MKVSTIKYKIISLIVVLSFLVIFSTVSAASNLDPTGLPSETMKTLEGIYQRITAGTVAGSHNLYPSSSLAGTMHTLTDIYNAIPINSEVCSGTNGGTAVCAPDEWSGELVGLEEEWYYATSFCSGNNGSTWIGRTPTIGELAKALAQQFIEGGSGPAVFIADSSYWSGSEKVLPGYTEAWVARYSSEGNISLTREGNSGNFYWVRCVK